MSRDLAQQKTSADQIKAAINLAAFIQEAAKKEETAKEKNFLKELSALVSDPKSKTLVFEITDQVFRTSSYARAADQLYFLLKKNGVPPFLSDSKKLMLAFFSRLATFFPSVLMPLVRNMIYKNTKHVILPGEEKALHEHLVKRKKEKVQLNLNHLGEAILGEEEAKNRLDMYLEDLKRPEITCISVKISTLYSQIQMLDFDKTLLILAERYKKLLLAAGEKLVNLDMEEYKDLKITVELFKTVLSDPECLDVNAGIVLQSYLPDSFAIQKELTDFAKKRRKPIKIRFVKGANLEMEKVEASIKGWPLAPYSRKEDTDANYKRMVEFALQKENAAAVKVGIGSHNVFDIAYAWILAEGNGVADAVTFEMLEGMAEPTGRVLQTLTKNLLLYCPVVLKRDFQNAVAYLMRRLDENTAPQNFLSVAFDLKPRTSIWEHQAKLFVESLTHEAPTEPHRIQPLFISSAGFLNEPDTDFSLFHNIEWGKAIISEWENIKIDPIPLVIGGRKIIRSLKGEGKDPSRPGFASYSYEMADETDIHLSLHVVSKGHFAMKELLADIAKELKKQRGRLMGAMLRDVGKSLYESDAEVSEAIDFANYYKHLLDEMPLFQPKGVILVASPWNFPCSIAAGGIISSLAAGNSVIFKPAPEAVLTGYVLAEALWNAGVPKDLLQFVPCSDEMASLLVKGASAVILTGATKTAESLLRLKPGLDLIAETGGKNSIIVTALSDRDLAIKDIVQSAFGFSGQKCSACSVLILEAEVFDDPQFKKQLEDAIRSLPVGSAYDPSSKVIPLIHPPRGALQEVLKEPSNLQRPVLLWDVKPGSFTQQNELFGPVLSVIRASDLSNAIDIANSTPYGLTAGLHSLDVREHALWLRKIVAGNCYINRGITGAIVGRQPFGGTKKSSFGPGIKAGGINALFPLIHVKQREMLPLEGFLPHHIEHLLFRLKDHLSENSLEELKKIAGNYCYHWKHFFSKEHEPIHLRGQRNIQKYVPYEKMILRIQKEDSYQDVIAVYMAAVICNAHIKVSGPVKDVLGIVHEETDEEFLLQSSDARIRLLSLPSQEVVEQLSWQGVWQMPKPVIWNGRVELLNYLREVSISYDYHRFGNVGLNDN